MKLPLLPQDKANHFIYGFFIYFILTLFFPPTSALAIICWIALGKELYDWNHTRKMELLDFILTILPGLILKIFN